MSRNLPVNQKNIIDTINDNGNMIGTIYFLFRKKYGKMDTNTKLGEVNYDYH